MVDKSKKASQPMGMSFGDIVARLDEEQRQEAKSRQQTVGVLARNHKAPTANKNKENKDYQVKLAWMLDHWFAILYQAYEMEQGMQDGAAMQYIVASCPDIFWAMIMFHAVRYQVATWLKADPDFAIHRHLDTEDLEILGGVHDKLKAQSSVFMQEAFKSFSFLKDAGAAAAA